MHKTLITIIFLGIFCLGSTRLLAQVRFTSTISPAQIHKDEYVTLKLSIENATDIQQLQPPSLSKFRIISGPNQESGMSNINGVVKQYIAVSYVLQPRQPGNIVIPPATAAIQGKIYKSSPVKLHVKNSNGNSGSAQAFANPYSMADPFREQRNMDEEEDYFLKKNETVADKVNNNMFVKVHADKKSCYVGEPVVAAYKLYTRLKSESKLIRNPGFNGFSVIDLQRPDVTGVDIEEYNGKPYNVYTIRKVQLYPLQAGSVELESASLENKLQFVKQASSGPSGNMYEDLLMPQGEIIHETVTLSSKPLAIEVKPLPVAGKPADFSGAVGQFSIISTIDKYKFSADETVKLTITISGAGNMQMITPPSIAWPEGIEAFEPNSIDKYNSGLVPIKGDKIFEYNFTAQHAGKYSIPPIKISFFNPNKEIYETIATPPILLNATAGSLSRQNSFAPEDNKTKSNPYLYWILILLAASAFATLFWKLFIKQKKKNISVPLPAEQKPVQYNEELINYSAATQLNPLEKTEACLSQDECITFYEILNSELKTFISAKLNVTPAEITSKSIAYILDNNGIENNIALEMQNLLQDIEWRLYTPFEKNEKMHEIYHQAMDAIQSLNAARIKSLTV